MYFPCAKCGAFFPAEGWMAVYCPSCEEAFSKGGAPNEVRVIGETGEDFLRRVEQAFEAKEEQNA